MTISLAPVAFADPPASPSAATTNRGGPSFGEYIDKADANATSDARQSAPSDGKRGNPAGSGANATDQSARSSSQAPAAGDRPAGKGSGKSNSSGRSTLTGGQGDGAAGGRGPSNRDTAAPTAHGTAGPGALTPGVPE